MPEEKLIRHCSPTLAGIKTVNLFTCRFENKKISICRVGIEIMPAYYKEYLSKYPDEYANPLDALATVGQTMAFPEMALLLREVQNYRGNGISARLFYESEVVQAVSLVIEWNRKHAQKQETRSRLSANMLQSGWL